MLVYIKKTFRLDYFLQKKNIFKQFDWLFSSLATLFFSLYLVFQVWSSFNNALYIYIYLYECECFVAQFYSSDLRHLNFLEGGKASQCMGSCLCTEILGL